MEQAWGTAITERAWAMAGKAPVLVYAGAKNGSPAKKGSKRVPSDKKKLKKSRRINLLGLIHMTGCSPCGPRGHPLKEPKGQKAREPGWPREHPLKVPVREV